MKSDIQEDPNELEVVWGAPIDHELAHLLGEPACDFLCVYADGHRMNRVGTPQDTPQERANQQQLVNRANSTNADSWWPEIRTAWKSDLESMFPKGHRPHFSLKVHRTVKGYSKYSCTAVTLLELPVVKYYSICKIDHPTIMHEVEVHTGHTGWTMAEDEQLAPAIAKAMVLLLRRYHPSGEARQEGGVQ